MIIYAVTEPRHNKPSTDKQTHQIMCQQDDGNYIIRILKNIYSSYHYKMHIQIFARINYHWSTKKLTDV